MPEASITRCGWRAGFSIHALPPRFFILLLTRIITAIPEESMKLSPDMSNAQSRGVVIELPGKVHREPSRAESRAYVHCLSLP